jgi:hypothetical protein
MKPDDSPANVNQRHTKDTVLALKACHGPVIASVLVGE